MDALCNFWLTKLFKSSSHRYYSICCSSFMKKFNLLLHTTTSAAILIQCSSHIVCCGHSPNQLVCITYTSTDMRPFIQHTSYWNTPKTANVPEQINMKLALSNPMPALCFCLLLITPSWGWHWRPQYGFSLKAEHLHPFCDFYMCFSGFKHSAPNYIKTFSFSFSPVYQSTLLCSLISQLCTWWFYYAAVLEYDSYPLLLLCFIFLFITTYCTDSYLFVLCSSHLISFLSHSVPILYSTSGS